MFFERKIPLTLEFRFHHNAWINTNIIKQKQYILLLSCAKKMFEQKRFAGRHLLTFESQVKLFWKKGGPTFWHYNVICITGARYLAPVICIWAMSDPFSRFLVIFYPLSPRNPLLKMFFSTLSFLWTTAVGPRQNV